MNTPRSLTNAEHTTRTPGVRHSNPFNPFLVPFLPSAGVDCDERDTEWGLKPTLPYPLSCVWVARGPNSGITSNSHNIVGVSTRHLRLRDLSDHHPTCGRPIFNLQVSLRGRPSEWRTTAVTEGSRHGLFTYSGWVPRTLVDQKKKMYLNGVNRSKNELFLLSLLVLVVKVLPTF